MATQNRNRARKKNLSNVTLAAIVFWLVFTIIIISVYIVNAQTIRRNFDLFITRLSSPYGARQRQPEAETIFEYPPYGLRDEVVIVPPVREQPVPPVVAPPAPEPQIQEPPAEPARQQPPPAQPPPPQQQRPQPPPPQPPPVQIRDRNVFFTQVDRDGQILHSRVTRQLPASESPMTDALNVMLMGPSAEELNRGLINLIPENTRILSAAVRGSTAYISFSEDFLFNTFGIEGYVAQLRQVVWTVTEFSNIRDVQILIEGRVIDFIGDGIWIGSPISRQSF